jgi:hypothetical protein
VNTSRIGLNIVNKIWKAYNLKKNKKGIWFVDKDDAPTDSQKFWRVVDHYLTLTKLTIKVFCLFLVYLWDDRVRHEREFREWLDLRRTLNKVSGWFTAEAARANKKNDPNFKLDLGEGASTYAGDIDYGKLRMVVNDYTYALTKMLRSKDFDDETKRKIEKELGFNYEKEVTNGME